MTAPEPRPHPYEIRPIERLEELHACEAVAKLVWQVDDREIVPASHLRSLAHGGGLVAGAFLDGALVGFNVGFLARHVGDERVGFHSHLMGVLPEHRRAGVAHGLKWFQRSWCLEHGLDWATWTFDPLQASSAHLNMERLGAVGERYAPDYYGSLGGVRFGSLPTDRILARWLLTSERVERLAELAKQRTAGVQPTRSDVEGPDADVPDDIETALAHGDGSGPGEPTPGLRGPWIRVAVPKEFEPLLYRDPAKAEAWRLAVRTVMEDYMGRGYRAVRFVEGAFLLHENGALEQSLKARPNKL